MACNSLILFLLGSHSFFNFSILFPWGSVAFSFGLLEDGVSRMYGMNKFLHHEPLAAGLFNRETTTSTATTSAWEIQLSNNVDLLSLVCKRMEGDYVALRPQMRKAYGAKEVETWQVINVWRSTFQESFGIMEARRRASGGAPCFWLPWSSSKGSTQGLSWTKRPTHSSNRVCEALEGVHETRVRTP